MVVDDVELAENSFRWLSVSISLGEWGGGGGVKGWGAWNAQGDFISDAGYLNWSTFVG